MPSIPFSEARAHLTDIANLVAFKGERVVLSRNTKDLIALISIEDLRRLEALEDKIDVDIAKKAKRAIKRSGTVSWEEAKKELGL